MRAIEAAGKTIGRGAPCFIAAEVGLNHNGDVELAHAMIDAAAAAGADGVKFQNFRTEDFISDRTLTYEYVSAGKRIVESQYDMFKRYELSESAFGELRDHCRDSGVVFFSTPTGFASLEQLVRLEAPLIKNGSDYLVHLPLIRAMAETGIPTVLSTGMATEDEVAAAVTAFREAGGTDLVLLHCTSSYPAPLDEVNLHAIPTLERRFDCPIGFSDHTDGVTAAVGAVTLGATFVEKHFTLDRALPGPDHRFSAGPEELSSLVRAIRDVEVAFGSGEIAPAPSEAIGRRDYRISCVAARDLPTGHVINRDDVAFRRPGTGLLPGEMARLLGRALTRDVAEGAPLSEEVLN